MRLDDLTRHKHKNKIGAVIIIVAILGVAYFGGLVGQVSVYPTSDYGDMHLYQSATDIEIGTGDLLNVQNGDYVTVWLLDDLATSRKPTDEDFAAALYLITNTGSTWIADGTDRGIYGYSFNWLISLESCLQGTYEYFVKYFARIGPDAVVKGESIIFQVVNTQLPTYDDADITIKPDDVTFGLGQSPAYVEWRFSYDGPCVVDVTLNGVEVDSQAYEASGSDQIFMYIVDTGVAGTYTIIFTVTPDNPNNPSVSDTVRVIIETATYDDVEIIVRPDDNVDFSIDESPAYVLWTFLYDGSCNVDVTLDGIEVDSQIYSASTTGHTFTYFVNTSITGEYEIIFTVTPDITANPSVSDTIIVTVRELTDTTTTDTGTTTTGTTTPPPDELGFDYMLLAIGAAAVVIVGFVMLKKRSEY